MSQVYFEDVEPGQEIPALKERCDSRRLVMWAAAVGDFYQIHYDKDYAQSSGLPDRIVHGSLKHALLGRLLHQWVSPAGRIVRYGCQYRGMDPVDSDVLCRGVVKRKYQEGGQNLVELEIWTEDARGQRTSPGSAVVALPAR